eukprot:NODE_224_length_1618_cov_186.702358_g158_i0.p1 GENE.NODE_224_length_1618_cov_186.702358_g158_i0~~NODE_224_length_1618_cov_186.702358_g158_i0.p1  ORF type:complete len:436 (+),score=142.60 NODE_224_length_1618_cov_186.702358_g158_i0:277-1584(+)
MDSPDAAAPVAQLPPAPAWTAFLNLSRAQFCKTQDTLFTDLLWGRLADGPDVSPFGPLGLNPSFRRAVLEYRTLASAWVPSDKKVLVFKCYSDAGAGNQILPMLSTFALGLLMRRVVLLHCPHFLGASELFCPPFPTWHIDTALYNRLRPTLRHVYWGNPGPDNVDSVVLCDDLTAPTAKGLVLDTNQYFVPGLFASPYLSSRMRALFPNPDLVFPQLLRLLFRPTPEVLRPVHAYADAHFRGRAVAGIQIRWAQSLDGSRKLFKVVDACVALPGSDQYIFVSTMYKSVHQAFQRWRPQRVLPPTSGVGHGGGEGGQKLHNVAHNLVALVDMVLLAQCQKLIVAHGSTFGYVAHGARSTAEAYFLEADTCVRRTTNQPCYHTADARNMYPTKSCPAHRQLHGVLNRTLPRWEVYLTRPVRRAMRAKGQIPVNSNC